MGRQAITDPMNVERLAWERAVSQIRAKKNSNRVHCFKNLVAIEISNRIKQKTCQSNKLKCDVYHDIMESSRCVFHLYTPLEYEKIEKGAISLFM